jgi:hypothetical protein
MLLAAVLLVTAAAGSAGCTLSCPAALATGVLTASGAELVLAGETGDTQVVAWPDGYGVRQDGDRLVLTNRFGFVMAREGDRIDMGGGVGADDVFQGCGDIVVRAAASR